VTRGSSIEWNERPERRALRTVAALVFTMACGSSAYVVAAAKASKSIEREKISVARSYARLPLAFEKNEGQFKPTVKFAARGSGYAVFLTNDGARIEVLSQKSEGRRQKLKERSLPGFTGPPQPIAHGRPAANVFRLKLLGANPDTRVTPLDELPAKVNYLMGRNSKKWLANVPLYSKVRYADVYPGIGFVFHGNGRKVEYDFEAAPGADPKVIRLGIEPRNAKITTVENGDLLVRMGGHEVRFAKPVVYQPLPTDSAQTNQNRRFLDGRYVLLPKNEVAFKIGDYDRSKPLVIDPVLDYSTFFGGTGFDYATAIAVDSAGDAFIAGYTTSADLPTAFPFQGAYGGGSCNNDLSPSPCFDAFVAKLNPQGDALLYATYLGGSGDDRATGIAVDSAGEAFVAGYTGSSDFPTASALQASIGGGTCGSSTNPYPCYDAFVARLSASGSSLIYSTFLGASGDDYGTGLAVDSSLNAYITGFTSGGNFPVTNGAMQTAFGGGPYDAFVAKIAPNGSSLQYSTLLGGSGEDRAAAIAVDSAGNAYVTGQTNSANFPVHGAFQASYSGGPLQHFDAFVTKLNSAGSAAVYSTYLGGQGGDYGDAIALDSSDGAYVAGWTTSADFPVTGGAYQRKYAGSDDAFISKISAKGNALVYSTFLGGIDPEVAKGIAVDASGDALIAGSAYGEGFPSISPLQSANGGFYDAFVAALNSAGSKLLYATWLGGAGDDYGNAIAAGQAENAYVAGGTFSTDFPTTPGVFATSYQGGGYDAFVAKISPASAPGVSLMPDPATFGEQKVGATSPAHSVTLMNAGSVALDISRIKASGDFSATSACGSTLPPGMGCTINVTFTPSTSGALTGGLSIWDNAAGSPQTEVLAGMGANSLPAASLKPATLTFGDQAIATPSAPQQVTITNSGAATLDIASLAVSGDFSQSADCGAALAPGAICTVSVVFTPSAQGTRTGWLTLTDNAPDSPQTVALSGSGGADFSLSAASATATIIRGTNQANFVISASTPPGFAGTISLACSGSGQAACTFDPASISAGGGSSTLTVSNLASMNANSLTLTVTGTGGTQTASISLSIEFADFSLAASPSSVTVTAGQTGDYQLSLGPMNGFNFPVSASCSGAPPGATCSLSPAAVTLNGKAASTIQVSVATAVAGAAPASRGLPTLPGSKSRPAWVGLALVVLVLLDLAGSRQRGPLSRSLGKRALSFAMIAMLLSACGGGGGGIDRVPPPSQGPAKTYVITLTAKSGTLSHAATVSLNLN
jgi:Beta-propeller repeat/Abnormal spindle-like microcephaly-assoc'd, ASPM-SPD-2-Hydin